MKLQLPANVLTDSQAAFEFEGGVFAGRAFDASLYVCSNPACDCRTVTFKCAERADPGVDPPREPDGSEFGAASAGQPGAKLHFTLALKDRQLDLNDPPAPAPEAALLAAAFLEEMTAADWQSLEALYGAVKRSQTEGINPDEIEARFPDQVLADPSLLVGFGEVFPHAETLRTSGYGGHWFALDQYCVNPICRCRNALLNFVLVPEGATQLQHLSADGPSLFYDHERGTIDTDSPHDSEARALLVGLIRDRPDLKHLLGERHRLLRRLFARQQTAPPAPAPVRRAKIGRNDPCPCGSGRKYKKCCGGPNARAGGPAGK
jgi:hypothetical protein